MDIKGKLLRAYRYIRYGIPSKNVVYANIGNLSYNNLLEGKTALITGGTGGIGLNIAMAFLRSGAKVIITGRTEEKLDNAFNQIHQQISNVENRLYKFKLDVTNINQIESCILDIIENNELQSIDILVNNAGINTGISTDDDESRFERIIQTNLKGTYFMSKCFAEYLRKNEIKGNILNLASSSSERPATEAYTLSKWGIKGLTKGLARVYTKYGIVCNAIAPGPTATRMIKGDRTDNELTHERNLTGRMCHPIEVANLAVVMVSDICRMVVGNVIYISGGSGNVYNEDINYSF